MVDFVLVHLTLGGAFLNDRFQLRQKIMGDKSPKSTQKLSGQKKVKADKIKRKKKAAKDAKQVFLPKK